jgi:hypothetical protein
MELTEGSETSENYNLTPGKYPKEQIQQIILLLSLNSIIKNTLIMNVAKHWNDPPIFSEHFTIYYKIRPAVDAQGILTERRKEIFFKLRGFLVKTAKN